VSTRTRSFGPTAIATPANALTAFRLLAAPVFTVAVVLVGPSSWWLWVTWFALTSSDGLDGHIARRHGTTRSGAFLDPLADKFLVLGALGALVGISYLSWVPVAIIGVREISMSVFRVQASRRGVSIPARRLAKIKTLVQDLAIGCAFFPPVGHSYPIVCRTMIWVAVALTLYTGFEYLSDGRRLVRAVDNGVGDRLAQHPAAP